MNSNFYFKGAAVIETIRRCMHNLGGTERKWVAHVGQKRRDPGLVALVSFSISLTVHCKTNTQDKRERERHRRLCVIDI